MDVPQPNRPSTAAGSTADPEEATLLLDPRLAAAIDLFNAGEWYGCHDGFEELWHETAGPCRSILQGILQIAVAQLHQERGNRHGATILTGEGLGRLRDCGPQGLGLDLEALRQCASLWLRHLQNDEPVGELPPPCLRALVPPDSPVA